MSEKSKKKKNAHLNFQDTVKASNRLLCLTALLLKHRLVSQNKPVHYFDEMCLLIRAEQYAKKLYCDYFESCSVLLRNF